MNREKLVAPKSLKSMRVGALATLGAFSLIGGPAEAAGKPGKTLIGTAYSKECQTTVSQSRWNPDHYRDRIRQRCVTLNRTKFTREAICDTEYHVDEERKVTTDVTLTERVNQFSLRTGHNVLDLVRVSNPSVCPADLIEAANTEAE